MSVLAQRSSGRSSRITGRRSGVVPSEPRIARSVNPDVRWAVVQPLRAADGKHGLVLEIFLVEDKAHEAKPRHTSAKFLPVVVVPIGIAVRMGATVTLDGAR